MAVFIVEIPDLNGMTKKETEQYIRDAVGHWSGQFPPDHPFFAYLSTRGNMTVRTLSKADEAKLNRVLAERPVSPSKEPIEILTRID